MMQSEAQIEQALTSLRELIETTVDRKMKTPRDFDFLSEQIFDKLHETVSPTTLKRLWGYIEGADTTRRTTLCLLSRFLGYDDWETYLAALSNRTDVESETFAGEGLNIDDLQPGEFIEVTWLPNRRCVFRYDGDAHFTVTQAENTKLHVGDRFETACFIIGKPLYIDRLVRGDEPPTAYVAGAKNGLLKVERLKE